MRCWRSFLQRERSHIPTTSDAFVDFTPGGETPGHLAQLQRQIGTEYQIFRAEPPVDILSFGRVQNLPVLWLCCSPASH